MVSVREVINLYNKPLYVGNIKLPSNILMAPLVDYTPYPFRLLAQKLGAGLAITEMVSTNALKYKDKANAKLLFTTELEKVKCVQFLGGNPYLMEKMAHDEAIEEFDIIDINMGCPVPNVIKSGEGCAIMADPKRAAAIIKGCKKSGKLVTVKCRIGLMEGSFVITEFAKVCEDAGADMITIHGRARSMMYSGEPYYDEIRRAKMSVSIPVIANGDIFSLEKARQVLAMTNADGVMVARYALSEPRIFSQYVGKSETMSKLDMILFLLEHTSKHFDETFTLAYIKRMTSYFTKKLPGTKQYKMQLSACGNVQELRQVLELVFANEGDVDE